jgi:ComF family protein
MLNQLYNKSISIAKSVYDDFREFLSPSACLCCGKDKDFPDPILCPQCIEILKRKNIGDGPVCPFCGRPAGTVSSCERCRAGQVPDLYFWGYYDDELKECLLQFKFHGALELGTRLSEMAIEALGERIVRENYDFIIPVPLHQNRQRERRFNQSEIIAREISELLQIELRNDLLDRPRATRQQAKLTENDRWNNVKNAFMVIDGADKILAGKSILLVDDIVTTGATVFEASRPILKSGARKLDILSISYAR